VDGLIRLLETVGIVRERLNSGLRLAGILACRVDARTRLGVEVVEVLRKRYREETLRTVIRENVRLREAYAAGQPINVYDPYSAGAEDYRKLAVEIIRQERRA
jgi:chromosome partitioning protein